MIWVAKEWNTDMDLDADFVLDKDAQKIADEAAKSSTCIPIGEGEIAGKHLNKIFLLKTLFLKVYFKQNKTPY